MNTQRRSLWIAKQPVNKLINTESYTPREVQYLDAGGPR